MANLKELILFSKSLNALYVEDDAGIRDNYAKVFAEVFDTLDVAEDGQEGLEKFKAGDYDIVITDINMPRMNGIDMIRNILQENDEQPIIVTSAHDEAQYLLQLIDLGIEKFLIKPVDFAKMTTILYRSCKRIKIKMKN
jgi:YesN/AraC family two-component response regulator